MRIALVTDTYLPDINGVAMTLGRLVNGLLQRGHAIDLFKPASHAPPSRDGRHVVLVPRLSLDELPSIPLPGYPDLRLGLPATRHIRASWKNRRPDAVYVATESPLGFSAIRAARSLNVPVLSGFHTNFHTYMQDYQVPILEKAATHYLRALHNKTSFTLAPSEDTAHALAGQGFRRVRVLGRGVDTALFDPEKRDPALRSEWNADDRTPVAIFVGRLAAEKNLDLAAKTFRELQQLKPDTRAVFVGDGPQRSALEKAHPDFIYAGMRRDDDLARHYASADIFISPSLSETFGNVLLEALASGLVSVSFNYASALKFVKDGVNGFTVPFGDEAAFIRQARHALPQWNSSTIRHHARETSLGISWDRIVDQFEQDLKNTIRVTPRRTTTRTRTFMSEQTHPNSKPAQKKKKTLRFKTIFISDVHLGTPDCKITQLNHFMRHTRCEKLVLNGDIIDGWALARSGKWTKSHTYFVRLVLKKVEKFNTEVIYLRGNHDDILHRFLPLKFDNLRIVNEHVHPTPHGNYLVVHGDGFDTVTTNWKPVAMAGAVGYSFLLRLNRLVNWYRRLRGKSYFSLSKYAKNRVKQAVSFVGRYEEQLQRFAYRKGCHGIICGHIHTPADKMIGDIHYLNSGDWVESLSVVVENLDRSFEVLTYEEFCRRAQRQPKSSHYRPAPSRPKTAKAAKARPEVTAS